MDIDQLRERFVDYLYSGTLQRRYSPLWRDMFVLCLALFNFEFQRDRVLAILEALSVGPVRFRDNAWLECQTKSSLKHGNVRDCNQRVQLAFQFEMAGPFGALYMLWQKYGAKPLSMSKMTLKQHEQLLYVGLLEIMPTLKLERSTPHQLVSSFQKSIHQYIENRCVFEQFEIEAIMSNEVLSRSPVTHTVYRSYLSPEFSKPATTQEIATNRQKVSHSSSAFKKKLSFAAEISSATKRDQHLRQLLSCNHDGLSSIVLYLLNRPNIKINSRKRYVSHLLPLLDEPFETVFSGNEPPQNIQNKLIGYKKGLITAGDSIQMCETALNEAAQMFGSDFRIKSNIKPQPGKMIRSLILSGRQWRLFLKNLAKEAPDPTWAIQWQLIAIFMRRFGCRFGEVISRRLIDLVLDGPNPRLIIRPYSGVSLKSDSATRVLPLALLLDDELALLKQWLSYRKSYPDTGRKSSLLWLIDSAPLHKLEKHPAFRSMNRAISSVLFYITGWPGCVQHSLRHCAISDIDVLLNGNDEQIITLTDHTIEQANAFRTLLSGTNEQSSTLAIERLMYCAGHLDAATAITHYRHHFATMVQDKIRQLLPVIDLCQLGLVKTVSWGKYKPIRDISGQTELVARLLKQLNLAKAISNSNNSRAIPNNLDWWDKRGLSVACEQLPALVECNQLKSDLLKPFAHTIRKTSTICGRKKTPRLLFAAGKQYALRKLQHDDLQLWQRIAYVFGAKAGKLDVIALNALINKLNRRTGVFHFYDLEDAALALRLLRKIAKVGGNELKVRITLSSSAKGVNLSLASSRFEPDAITEVIVKPDCSEHCQISIELVRNNKCRHLLTHWFIYYLSIFLSSN